MMHMSLKEKKIHAVILNHCHCIFCLPRAKQKRFCHITDSQMRMFCNVHSETAEDSEKSLNSLFLVQEIISLEPIALTSTRNPCILGASFIYAELLSCHCSCQFSKQT